MILPPSEIKRIVYMGTPALAVAPLLALHDAGYEIPLVVTRPDAKRGRGATLTPSPVKRTAMDLGIEVSHDVDDALAVNPDLAVVVAFGQIIKPHVLDQLAMVNIHFSLLPRWRGAAPVERAILAGDEVTGVCLMVLAEELDVGDVYRRAELTIEPSETLDELRARLVELGTTLLVDTLEEGLGTPTPQEGEATWARKIQASELELDWSQPAVQVQRVIRLGNAWTTVHGKRLKVWWATPVDHPALAPGECHANVVGTSVGALELVEVQPEGKPRRTGVDWANGARLGPDDRLGA